MTAPNFTTWVAQDVGDVFSLEFDVSVLDKAVFRLEQAADGPQGGRLAGPIGSQQGNDTAFGHAQADAAQDLNNVVVDDFDVVDIEKIAVGMFGLVHFDLFLNGEGCTKQPSLFMSSKAAFHNIA